MVIDQRNAGASVTVTAGGYTLDRFLCAEDTDGTISVQQVTDGPTGFTNSMKFTVGTADASLGAAQYVYFRQAIEGFNFADCEFGTANAKTVTVSFWVKSNITGTFGGNIASTSHNRSYAFAYTINSADTWEYKTATIPGDTSGTWNKTNSIGAYLHFCLASGATYLQSTGSWAAGTYIGPTGQTNLMATTANTFNITGVQLERGSVATSFDYRSFGTELGLCQRYYYKSYSTGTLPGTSTAAGGWFSQNYAANAICIINARWIVEMRNAPTVTTYSLNGTSGKLSDALGTDQTSTATNSGTSGCIAYIITGTLSEANGHFVASAEL